MTKNILKRFEPSALQASAAPLWPKFKIKQFLYVFKSLWICVVCMYHVVTLLLPSCDNILGKWTWPKIV